MKKITFTPVFFMFFVLLLSGCASSRNYHQALQTGLPKAHDAEEFDFQGSYLWLANTGSMAPVVPYFPDKAQETKVGYVHPLLVNYEDLKPYMTVIRETHSGELVMHQIIRRWGNKWVMKGFANFHEDKELLTAENFQGIVTDVYVINALDTVALAQNSSSELKTPSSSANAVLTRQ